ncbi:hypothetical protein CROQUDRAFT_318901 [Cronartium quercuum f. sp. fusiforme G11]|uniref:Secreted protein n=1 Tax=Cronartium quercuum f. sp. fusiforme G11 TaxID=708437 RepID=A0A9P6NSI5_9BASI|nr:hypothetical protein CROQUDRAFT_318901 [Cronartium quercuum f. sp. fusiforme G11]
MNHHHQFSLMLVSLLLFTIQLEAKLELKCAPRHSTTWSNLTDTPICADTNLPLECSGNETNYDPVFNCTHIKNKSRSCPGERCFVCIEIPE